MSQSQCGLSSKKTCFVGHLLGYGVLVFCCSQIWHNNYLRDLYAGIAMDVKKLTTIYETYMWVLHI